MPPMDIKDWWLAAAAATSIASPLASAATQSGDQVGVVTAVRPGVLSSMSDRVVYIGNNVAFGERLKTDSSGVIHILFMDQSSMTLGPDSELVIDEFVFRPEQRQGNIAVNLIKGTLRAVGGFISKFNASQTRAAAQIRTTTATIGIRGGITLVEAAPELTRGVFLFGDYMEVSSPNGEGTQTVNRPGFSVTARPGSIEPPARFPQADMASLLSRFESRPGTQSAGASGGPLISTSDRPASLDAPGSTIANDRVQSVAQQVEYRTPDTSLRELLGSGSPTIQS